MILNAALNTCIGKIAKTLFPMLVLITMVACKNELQQVSSAPALSSEEHQQLILQTKRAILDLDIALVDRLTDKIDVNRTLPDHSTLLAWAVETQEPKLVNLLLEKGANAKVSASYAEQNQFTPIIQACRYGNASIIFALLKKGADPNDTIEDGTSAFQLCSGSASDNVLAKMVSMGADVNAENDYGQTALMWAANFAKVGNLNYLVELGANINQQTHEGYSPLFFAIKSQSLDTIKASIASGANLFAVAQDGTTAAQLAVYANNYDFLTWFIDEIDAFMDLDNIDSLLTAYDRDGYQLLHAAVKANQQELVSALLARGANPTSLSAPSTLSWRYEANFKTEIYIPPQLTPIELAEQNSLDVIASILRN